MKASKIIYFKTGGHVSHKIYLKYLDYYEFPIRLSEDFYNPKALIKQLPKVIRNIKKIKNTKIWLFEDIKIKKIIDFIYPKATEDKTTVGILASPIIYYFLKKIRVSVRNKISHVLFKKAINEIDYIVCSSNLVRKYIKLLSKNKEEDVFVVYPSPTEENIKIFSKAKPNLNKNNILFIGSFNDKLSERGLGAKGLNFLIDAIEYLLENGIPVKIYVIGKASLRILKKYKNKKQIIFLGYRNSTEIKKYIEKSSLYVHPALFDTFSISTIEAMYAGLPVIVSKNTGAREIVEKVKKDFVVDLDPKKIADKIIEYFNLSYNEKKELSESFREAAKEINPERSAREFKDIILKIKKERKN